MSKQQARKLQATLVRNYQPPTDRLTGVKCRATSVAKNACFFRHAFWKGKHPLEKLSVQ